MKALELLKEQIALGTFALDSKEEGAARRMADFDVLPPLCREMANEYGVLIVGALLKMGVDIEALEAACLNHRNTQQMARRGVPYGQT